MLKSGKFRSKAAFIGPACGGKVGWGGTSTSTSGGALSARVGGGPNL